MIIAPGSIRKEKKTAVRVLTGILTAILILTVAAFLASCGGEDAENKASGHTLSQEQQDRVVAETSENLEIVMGLTPETIDDLSKAMTGSALEDTKKGMEEDLTQGRYRKRDYRNINVRFTQYMNPIATEFVEFDDFGYYVDAKTGAALTQPTGEHRSYSIYVIEEDGRWKIRGLFEPSNPSTPREQPEETQIPAETVPAAPAGP